MKQISSIILSALALLLVMTGCDKTERYDVAIPESIAHFTNKTGGTYFILGPNITWKVPVGVTAASNASRTITVNVTSPTGAVAGTHYTLGSTTVTLEPGEVLDSIEVRGIFSQYAAGRKDTLVFTITEPNVKPSAYNSVYRLFMRGPCFEGDVNLNELLGAYANTREDFGGAYGPYRTTISAVQQLSPTTGTVTVTNIFDAGWNPITFLLDWTDPANRTVTLDAQSGIGNAGTVSSTYAGSDITVRPFAGQVGTFSACNGTLELKMQIGVTGVGFFGTLYTVNMAR